MRIAQVSPLFESVPPKLYGGTERVVSCLTEELVKSGHEVTLFASGDSVTSARLIEACPRSLRLDETANDHLAQHIVLMEKVFQHADEFDVIHFHIDYLHFPLTRRESSVNTVTTLHGRLDIQELQCIYDEYPEVPVVSISDAQRKPLPQANWVSTVHHGLPRDGYKYHAGQGGYLAFLGRVSPEKRLDRAIDIARRAGMTLKIAAKVDRAERDYFENEIEPLVGLPGVEFIGEISEAEKSDFLGRAYALLFPIDWPEPFGLVMVESMACGTPVVAYDHGSVPEVIEDGVTGFIASSEDEAVEAIRRIPTLNRADCRRAFEERFTSDRMARDYIDIYDRILSPVLA